MSSDPSTDRTRRSSIHEQRVKRQQSGKQPNRAQLRAAQTRAAQTYAPAPTRAEDSGDDAIAIGSTSPRATSQRLTQAQRRAVERGAAARGTGMPVGVMPLTKEQEMFMVREDLHRLLAIAGVLLVAMIVLLFFID